MTFDKLQMEIDQEARVSDDENLNSENGNEDS